MRLAVVAPSEQYLTLAGVRIRYMRLLLHLEALGHSLSYVQIADFHRLSALEHDAYLFSKCYDARTFLAARFLKEQGRIVGVDFFDDYFSQTRDSRFVRHREWLRTMSSLCDFYLCSTPRMQDVVETFMPATPGHVLNDPFDDFPLELVARRLADKAAQACASRRLDVAWFGVGDNPNFPVGLQDLAAYGDRLAQFQRRGFEVNLRVLTNRRAFGRDGLAALGRLDVPFIVGEWSRMAEIDLLDQSLLAFIPVNAQPFSIAKSLNRAVTALTGGCQVLSPGFPLYKPLQEFIYDSPDDLFDDLTGGGLRLRSETAEALAGRLTTWGDPEQEAARLAAFLSDLDPFPSPSVNTERTSGVLHGRRSPTDCHRAAQRLGQLSIGSPFSVEGLNYDIRPRFDHAGAVLHLSDAAVAFLDQGFAGRLLFDTESTGKQVAALRIAHALPGHPLDRLRHSDCASLSVAVYPDVMHLLRDALERLFPLVDLFLSELDSPLMEGLVSSHLAPPLLEPATGRAAT